MGVIHLVFWAPAEHSEREQHPWTDYSYRNCSSHGDAVFSLRCITDLVILRARGLSPIEVNNVSVETGHGVLPSENFEILDDRGADRGDVTKF